MRYAVLADIHGNLEALTAVIEMLAKERIDCYLCLGDVVGYGADPVACLSRVEDLKAVQIAGNHERACLGKFSDSWFNNAASAAITWTRGQLGFGELDGLRRLPLTLTEGPFTLVHGALKHPERFDYLFDVAQVVDSLRSCRTQFCLTGHTHLAFIVEYDQSVRRVGRVLTKSADLADVAIGDQVKRLRYLINPGSVGQPRDGNPQASFAVIDTESHRTSIRRASYDVETAARKIREANLPGLLADRLLVGR